MCRSRRGTHDPATVPPACALAHRPVGSRRGQPVGNGDLPVHGHRGSTRRWEADAGRDAIGAGCPRCGAPLRDESQNGWLFKHTGDGVRRVHFGRRGCTAAVEAQRPDARSAWASRPARPRSRGTTTRAGAEPGRAASWRRATGRSPGRSASTASLLTGVDLIDLERTAYGTLRTEHLYQVVADGLGDTFPPLRTTDTTPGNVTQPATSFVGRGRARGRRPAASASAGSRSPASAASARPARPAGRRRDGGGLPGRDLAGRAGSVGDGQAVPEAVAGVLGVTTSRTARRRPTIARTLSGRRVLLVRQLRAPARRLRRPVETVLARTTTTTVPATSREGLRQRRAGAAGPLLDTDEGTGSAAVQLFVERARSVNPAFEPGDPTATEAVIEICRRLDGIALAIELAVLHVWRRWALRTSGTA